jgi:hypothetical protein
MPIEYFLVEVACCKVRDDAEVYPGMNKKDKLLEDWYQ